MAEATTTEAQIVADAINSAGGNVTAESVEKGAERATKPAPKKPAPKKAAKPKAKAPAKKQLGGAKNQPERNSQYNGGKKFTGKAPKALVDAIKEKQAKVASPRAALRFVAKHVGDQATMNQFIESAVAAGNTPERAKRCWEKGRGLPIT